jgi:hypothetical protein
MSSIFGTEYLRRVRHASSQPGILQSDIRESRQRRKRVTPELSRLTMKAARSIAELKVESRSSNHPGVQQRLRGECKSDLPSRFKRASLVQIRSVGNTMLRRLEFG